GRREGGRSAHGRRDRGPARPPRADRPFEQLSPRPPDDAAAVAARSGEAIQTDRLLIPQPFERRAIYWAALAAIAVTAFLAALSSSSLFIHTFALSEALFIFFSLLSLGILLARIEWPSWGGVLAAALLAGAAGLTRYAAATVPAGALLLLLLSRKSLARRIIMAAFFCLVSTLPAMGWWIRNRIVLGSATNRVLALHPIGWVHIRDAARTTLDWLFWAEPIHPALTGLAALIALAVVIAG